MNISRINVNNVRVNILVKNKTINQIQPTNSTIQEFSANYNKSITNNALSVISFRGVNKTETNANENSVLTKKSIKDLTDIRGKRALVRVDVNVPMDENQNITDDTRIRAIIPTLEHLQEKGAKIVLMAHLGKPKGKVDEKLSLKPVADYMSTLLDKKVKFIPNLEEAKDVVNSLEEGEIALLENIRFHKAEEAKDDDITFAKQLAELGDFYVNDAFGAAHRNHASTSKVAQILKPAVSGLLMEKEINCLSKALDNPERPFTAVVGGAKVSTKIGVLENLVEKVDNLIIGGGMAYTFVKAMGGEIGDSLCEDNKIDVAKRILEKAEKNGVNIYFDTEVLVTDDTSGNGTMKIVRINEIPKGFKGVDSAPSSVEKFAEIIKSSKTILMNGPVGIFEKPQFAEGTKGVLKAIAEATKDGITTVIGGGDSVKAAKKFQNEDDFTHVSTGGGASLEFMEGKILPGVASLDDKTS